MFSWSAGDDMLEGDYNPPPSVAGTVGAVLWVCFVALLVGWMVWIEITREIPPPLPFCSDAAAKAIAQPNGPCLGPFV